MKNEEVLCAPPSYGLSLSRLLSRNIAAIELNGNEDGSACLGPVQQLPNDSALDVCGDGFNEKTVKIRLNGKYYFVFRADLGLN